MAAFGSLQKSLDKCKRSTALLSIENKKLGESIQQAIANRSPVSYIAHMTREYEKQERVIEGLKLKTRELSRVQNYVAAQKQKREELRGQIMETAGLAYLVSKPLKVGIEFEASMSKVQALTRLDKNSTEMKALTDQARQLGAQTSFTASEAAQAQGFLAMAGFKPEQILKSMPSMLDLAKAGGVDLQRTADIASNIQTAFGLDASQMTRISDTLTMAFTTSNVDLNMLAESMKYAGPVAKALGVSLEETSAIVGMLGNAGIQGSMAGTTMRNALNNLTGSVPNADKILKKLGVTTKDAQGNMRSYPEILYNIAKATEGMGNAERANTLTNIFGIRAAPGMMAVLSDAEKIKPYIDAVKNSEGAAAKTAAVMGNNTEGALKEMESAWQDLSIFLTDTEKGPLTELIRSFAELLRGVSAFVKENPVLFSWIIKIGVGLLTMRAAWLATSYGISLFKTGLLSLKAGFQIFQTMKLLSSVIGIKAAFFAVVSPVGLVVAAIAAVVAIAFLIYKYWEPIKGFFVGLWDGIVGFFSSGIENITASILNWSPLGMFYRGFASLMSWFGVELPGNFSEFGANILNGLIGGLTAGWNKAKEFVVNLGENIKGWFCETLGINSPSRVFMEFGGFTMQGLADGLKTAASLPLAAMQAAVAPMVAAGSIAVASPAMAAPVGGGSSTVSVTVNVYPAPGMDEKALAELVARKIADAQRAADASRRARLSDSD